MGDVSIRSLASSVRGGSVGAPAPLRDWRSRSASMMWSKRQDQLYGDRASRPALAARPEDMRRTVLERLPAFVATVKVD